MGKEDAAPVHSTSQHWVELSTSPSGLFAPLRTLSL